MKLYHEDDVDDIRAGKGLLLETVDCVVCGAIMVPHLFVLDDGKAIGFCTQHVSLAGKMIELERVAFAG